MKKVLQVFCTFMIILSFIGCANITSISSDTNTTDETTTESKDKALVYMSGPESMINKLESLFEDTHGDVLDITILSCGQLRHKVWTESQSGDIEADIIFGSDPILFNKLDEIDKLEGLVLSEADKIDSLYKVTNHNYALVVERYVVLMATDDTQRLSTVPTSYSDLSNTIYEGKVAMADASLSATALAIGSALYEVNGNSMNIFSDLANNNVILAKSNGMIPSGILDGTYDIGIAPHDSFIRLSSKAKKDGYELNLTTIWPSEGAIALQRPIAISKKVNRPAKLTQVCNDFVDFLLSKQGQSIQYNNGFVSVRTDIENKYLPASVTVNRVDWDYAATNEDTFKTAYDNIFKN